MPLWPLPFGSRMNRTSACVCMRERVLMCACVRACVCDKKLEYIRNFLMASAFRIENEPHVGMRVHARAYLCARVCVPVCVKN